jgi:hypothetical protein
MSLITTWEQQVASSCMTNHSLHLQQERLSIISELTEIRHIYVTCYTELITVSKSNNLPAYQNCSTYEKTTSQQLLFSKVSDFKPE